MTDPVERARYWKLRALAAEGQVKSAKQAEPALRLTVTVDDSNPLGRHHFELVWLQTPHAAGEYLYYAAPPVDPAKRERARELVEQLLYATRDIVTGQRLDAGVCGHAPIEDLEEAATLLKEAYGL